LDDPRTRRKEVTTATTRTQAAFGEVLEVLMHAPPPEPGDRTTDSEREERAGSIVDSDALGLAWSTLAGEERDVGEAERFVMMAALTNARAG
jgi:hypothetical protein